MSVLAGDVFPKCKIIEESDEHYFLENMGDEMSWYDIVMPKEFVKKNLKVGQEVSVKVDCIRIADDGTPGAFVKLVVI